MKINRSLWILAAVYFVVSDAAAMEKDIGDFVMSDSKENERSPRAVSLYSYSPDDEEGYRGWRINKHINNVLQGGRIGLEMNFKEHMGKLAGLWQKVKKYLPKIHRLDNSGFLPVDRSFAREKNMPEEKVENDIPGKNVDDIPDEGRENDIPESRAKDIPEFDFVEKGIINPRVKPAKEINAHRERLMEY